MTTAMYPAHTQSKEYGSDVEVLASSASKSKKMSVNTEGLAHIMSLLTDLYSNPERSVLREYFSNAYDSHVEAGQTKPVKVFMPSYLNPSLTIQDWGVGLSEHDILEIYSSYGASTKRKSLDVLGAYGLGCKSALTLTQQFTLVGVKDGFKTVANIARGEDGVGEVNIVSSSPTDEENGVSVTIPIHNVSSFIQETKNYFLGVDNGVVLVDEQPPVTLYNSDNYVSWGSDGIVFTHKSSGWGAKAFVVMGGVVYDASRAIPSGYRLDNSIRLYIKIPIASVDLTPSREDIRWTDRSSRFLEELIKDKTVEVLEEAKKNVENSDTAKEALLRFVDYKNLHSAYYTPGVTWDGRDLISSVSFGHSAILLNSRSTPDGNQTWATKKEVRNTIPLILGTSRRYFVVVDTDEGETRARRDFRGWAEKNGVCDYGTQLLIFRDNKPDTPFFIEEEGWFTEVKLSDLSSDATAWRKERRAAAKKAGGPRTTAPKATYPVAFWDADDEAVSLVDLEPSDITKDMVLIEEAVCGAHFFKNLYTNNHTDSLKALDVPSTQFVFVSARKKVDVLFRKAKVESLTTYSAFADKLWEKHCKGVKRLDLYSDLYLWGSIADILRNLAEFTNEIEDPDVKVLTDQILSDKDSTEIFHHVERLNAPYKPEHKSDQFDRSTIEMLDLSWKHLKASYPLAFSYGEGSMKHRVSYINAMYNATKGQD